MQSLEKNGSISTSSKVMNISNHKTEVQILLELTNGRNSALIKVETGFMNKSISFNRF